MMLRFKAFKRKTIYRHTLAGMVGMLGAFVIILLTHFFILPISIVGTVNITGLVDQFIKQETSKNLSDDLLKKEVGAFGALLDKEIKTFSQQHHIILLPREAILAGGRDYTVEIRNRMQRHTDDRG